MAVTVARSRPASVKPRRFVSMSALVWAVVALLAVLILYPFADDRCSGD
jgi:hypothetical protein